MASAVYNAFKTKLMSGADAIDFDLDTIKCALVTSTYVPNIDTHAFFSSITNEVVGTGYTAGGATLASVTVTQDNTDDEGVLDAADTSWPSSTITARGAIIYKSTGVAATSPLVAYIDFGADYVSTGGTFLITWAAEGIININ